MEEHRIALISDTHGLLRQEVADRLESCEMILHAGDVGKPEILNQLRLIAATYAVRGNVDQGWPDQPPQELDMELFGFHIYMVHNKKHIRKDLSGVDIVAYGHSHILSDEIRPIRKGLGFRTPSMPLSDEDNSSYTLPDRAAREEIRYLNPGSCGPKRFRLPVTMMILTLFPAEHRLNVEKIACLTTVRPGMEAALKMPQKDMYKLIRIIMKEVDAGKNIADIAIRNQIDEEFAEQVCRMYVTHPGVDVDGIMDRIERRNL